MKNLKSIFTAWLVIVLFISLGISCTVKPLDFPETTPIPVLNAVLISGTIPEVSLSYSLAMNVSVEVKPTDIKDAEVQLYEEDQWVENLVYNDSNSMYVGNHIIQYNKRYKITAELSNGLVLEGETTLPNLATISLVQVKDTSSQLSSGGARHAFFSVQFASDNQGAFPHIFSTYYSGVEGVPHSISTDPFLRTYYYSTHPFKTMDTIFHVVGDYTINPGEIRPFSYIQDKDGFVGQIEVFYDSLYTQIEVFSEELYHYVMRLNELESFNPRTSPYREPPVSVSNVKNGQGIVGGVARSGLGTRIPN